MALTCQHLTAGNFTKSDVNELQKRLALVFGVPAGLGKKDSTARHCYLSALELCNSYGFLQIVFNNSISKCHDQRRSVLEAVLGARDSKYDLHSNTYNVLVAIGEKSDFTKGWTAFIKGFEVTGLANVTH
jgi:hypothetical protein